MLSTMTPVRAVFIAAMPIRASAPASAVPCPIPSKQLTSQFPADLFEVHKVAISTAVADIFLVLSTGGFTKISHRREINNDGPSGIESPSKILQCICSLLFLTKLNINITNHVISQIVTNIQALNLSILVQFFKQVFIKILKMFLDFARINRIALSINTRGN